MSKKHQEFKFFTAMCVWGMVASCMSPGGGPPPTPAAVVQAVDAGRVVAPRLEPDGPARFPFEATTRGETRLFRTPKTKEESVTVPAGTVLTVTEPSLKGERNGQELLFVAVKPSTLSTLYAFQDDLEPLKKGAPISAEEASALMLREVPEPQRAWCQKSVRRILLPEGGKEGATTLAFSPSADQACHGYLAILGISGGKPLIMAETRRAGALLSVTPRATTQGLLIEVREGLLGDISRSGVVRALLAPTPSSLKELLVIEESVHDLKSTPNRRLTGTLELRDTASGVEFSARRIEEVLGAKTGRREEKLRYLYSKGEVMTAHQVEGH